MGKSTKRASKPALNIVMAVDFKVVNSGHNIIVASNARHGEAKKRQKKYGQTVRSKHDYQKVTRTGHTSSKAIDIDVDFNSTASLSLARVEAVREFMRGIRRRKDSITLLVSDPDMALIISKSPPPEYKKAHTEWKKLTDEFDIKVIFNPLDTEEPESRHVDLIGYAAKALQTRENSILSR